MENCLVTKLKSEVNNDNLEKLGTFRFKINVPSGLSDYSQYWMRIENSPGVVVSVPEGKNIYLYENSTKGASLGNTVTTASWNNYCFGDAGEYYVTIDKYLLKKIRFPIAAQLDFSKLSYVPLEQLYMYTKYGVGTLPDLSETLNNVTINGENGVSQDVKIQLSDIIKQSSLARFTSTYYNFSGNAAEFGKLPKIAYLYIVGSSLTGTIENFVRNQVAQGKTTKSIVWELLNRSSITFNGHTFSQGYNTTFSWEPSQTAGKTVITNGSETVEINNV